MRISSIGYAVPSKRVTNEDILEEVARKSNKYFSSEELKELQKQITAFFSRSGTDIRYHRAEGETALEFGIKAGKDALDKAGLAPEDIDLLLYVGVGRGWIEPATCNVFIEALNLNQATGYDILDACASWLRGLQVAQLYINSGIYKNIMLMNCEFNFKEYCSLEFKSFNDVEYFFPGTTIGEAATATILTDFPDNDFYFTFRTWGEKHKLCKIPLPNLNEYTTGEFLSKHDPLTFYSYGEKLFKFALSRISRHFLSDDYLKKCKYDIVFSHAASDPMSNKTLKLSKVDISKSYTIHSKYGNPVSASVPLAMGVATDEGSLKKDDDVLIGFGSAGFTSAWCAFKNK